MLNPLIYIKKSKPNEFVIASHGQTATLWLAAALNANKSIFCTHGYNYPPVATQIAEISIADQVARDNLTAERFWQLSLNEFMNELRANTNLPVIGNVHAFIYRRIHSLTRFRFRLRSRKITIMNMVRHPVTRVESMVRCWTNSDPDRQVIPFVEHDFEHRSFHIRKQIENKYSLDHTQDYKKFVVALLAIEDITKDILLAYTRGNRNIQFEKITTNLDYFSDVVTELLPEKYVVQSEIEDMFSKTPKLNQHNKTNNPQTPEYIYNCWSDWQKEAFDFVIKSSGLDKIYTKLGYEV